MNSALAYQVKIENFNLLGLIKGFPHRHVGGKNPFSGHSQVDLYCVEFFFCISIYCYKSRRYSLELDI